MNSRGRSSRGEEARGYARLKRGIIATEEGPEKGERRRRRRGLSVHLGTARDLNYGGWINARVSGIRRSRKVKSAPGEVGTGGGGGRRGNRTATRGGGLFFAGARSLRTGRADRLRRERTCFHED